MELKDVKEILNDKVSFGFELDEELKKKLKEEGIVLVYGYSDDLMEFDGAIRDELDVYDGGVVSTNFLGDEYKDIEIEALWCKEENYDWFYKTEIEHENFDILGEPEYYKGDKRYCKGLIFYLKDILK